MPVILKLDFTDGSTETVRIPAEIWRRNSKQVTWQHVSAKTLKRAELDPLWETADADRDNNLFEGAGASKVLKLAPSRPEDENKLKDNELRVLPDSLEPVPATPKPADPPK